ncbi:MAG: hypothetical protein SV186_02075 [Candidatus Nanohaloarchaea archaeon]|nr:hypothetical protein [Candidatus Nanohaloarchaea archaeon]
MNGIQEESNCKYLVIGLAGLVLLTAAVIQYSAGFPLLYTNQGVNPLPDASLTRFTTERVCSYGPGNATATVTTQQGSHQVTLHGRIQPQYGADDIDLTTDLLQIHDTLLLFITSQPHRLGTAQVACASDTAPGGTGDWQQTYTAHLTTPTTIQKLRILHDGTPVTTVNVSGQE